MRPCELCHGAGFVEDEGSAIGRAFLMGVGVSAGEIEKLRAVADAAQKLADKIEAMSANEEYKSVWSLYGMHGYKYSGPQIGNELTFLEIALASLDKKEEGK